MRSVRFARHLSNSGRRIPWSAPSRYKMTSKIKHLEGRSAQAVSRRGIHISVIRGCMSDALYKEEQKSSVKLCTVSRKATAVVWARVGTAMVCRFMVCSREKAVADHVASALKELDALC